MTLRLWGRKAVRLWGCGVVRLWDCGAEGLRGSGAVGLWACGSWDTNDTALDTSCTLVANQHEKHMPFCLSFLHNGTLGVTKLSPNARHNNEDWN